MKKYRNYLTIFVEQEVHLFYQCFFILQLKSSMGIRQYSVKSLRKSFDAVNMKDAARAAEDVLIENVAFQELSTNGSCSHDQE